MLQYNIDLNGKTILVTGAAGFIGSNLVKRLLNAFENIKVIGMDSITDYYDVRFKYERIEEIERIIHDNLRIIPDNSRSPTSSACGHQSNQKNP